MQALNLKNISLDEINVHPYGKNEISASVLRLDKVHPDISGNKWFKLKFYVEDAIAKKKSAILTFGGAWSNHIIATAAAGKLNGLQSIGLIRGEKPAIGCHTLEKAAEYGMKFIFMSRNDYKQKLIPAELTIPQDDLYIINEGGYGEKGAAGAATIDGYYPAKKFTHIICAVGTGTTMAGLIKGALPDQPVIGISVLKNNTELLAEVDSLLTIDETKKPYAIIHDYHFGGYAKHTPYLISFMNEFYRETSIPADFVYTGKLFAAVKDLARKNYFPAGSRLLIIHSGGLQGNNSLARDTLIF